MGFFKFRFICHTFMLNAKNYYVGTKKKDISLSGDLHSDVVEDSVLGDMTAHDWVIGS